MWGRAGRRGRGLAVYVAGEDALDQFFCRHPDEFLSRPVEAAILDPESPEIYAEHLICAAHEAPLTEADEPILGAGMAPRTRRAHRGGISARAGEGLCSEPGRRLSGGARRAPVGVGGQLRADRRELRRAPRHDRGGAGVRHRARGGDLPAPGALVPGPRAGPQRSPRAARAVHRRLLHADQAREHDLHRAPASSSARCSA